MKRNSSFFFAVVLFLFLPINASAQNWDFVGEWRIELMNRPSRWSEIKYPVHLSIRSEDGVLTAYYTDAQGNTEKCSDFAASQNEIMFRTGSAGKKNLEFFGPVHRAILRKGDLKGFVFTDRKEFAWVGKRRPK